MIALVISICPVHDKIGTLSVSGPGKLALLIPLLRKDGEPSGTCISAGNVLTCGLQSIAQDSAMHAMHTP